MFGNRTISSRLCEARSQAEPGARPGGRLVGVCSRPPRPAGVQRHPFTLQISARLLLLKRSRGFFCFSVFLVVPPFFQRQKVVHVVTHNR